MKMQITVMPAWIAGIQVPEDASGNVHVNLDSSTPCWNDRRKVQEYYIGNLRGLRGFRGGMMLIS
jgi:hypothetical protein